MSDGTGVAVQNSQTHVYRASSAQHNSDYEIKIGVKILGTNYR